MGVRNGGSFPMAEIAATSEKVRVQLDFSKEAFDNLAQIQKDLGATSRAEVVRQALGVLKWAIHHAKNRDTILVQRHDGKQTEVEFPFSVF
jgi:hypothetical protein